MKIHDKMFVVKRGEGDLAYMTYYETNKAFLKRKQTGCSWARVKIQDEDVKDYLIENKPTRGFKIEGFASRYSTSNKLIRIKDPRDFVVEISVENLVDLLSIVSTKNGVIQDKCVWAGNELVKEGSKQYKEAVKISEKVEYIPFKNVEAGSLVKLEDGSEVVYLGLTEGSYKVKDVTFYLEGSGYSYQNYVKDKIVLEQGGTYDVSLPRKHYILHDKSGFIEIKHKTTIVEILEEDYNIKTRKIKGMFGCHIDLYDSTSKIKKEWFEYNSHREKDALKLNNIDPFSRLYKRMSYDREFHNVLLGDFEWL